ncbi:hypothetical protein [Lacipirellula limnantheis]|uniref:Uncharacterized protein n=1 Tax=Lacipirellula limnantheis TaxID=2528024 RepID=A0A517TZ61_9BACT|nr:hypothetical protein [Lacipirellula limnantheis]QDT73652.1 hypothetical protein I41_28420 [Lacipirellula limnantheis]
MSFDIHCHTCNLGTRTAKRKNPFTGNMQSVPVDDGLTDAERAAVRELLKSAGAAKPDDFGSYAVEFKDGGSAEVFASELGSSEQCDGLMASVHGVTPELVKFLWDLCRAGNMSATPIMEDEVVVVVCEEQRARVQGRWPSAVVIGSPDELSRLISGGVAAWQAYRDQVVGE